MIIELVVNIVLGALWLLLSGIDGVTPDVPSAAPFAPAFSLLNQGLPLDTMLQAIGATVLVVGATFPWFVGVYIYRLLPFKAS